MEPFATEYVALIDSKHNDLVPMSLRAVRTRPDLFLHDQFVYLSATEANSDSTEWQSNPEHPKFKEVSARPRFRLNGLFVFDLYPV